MDTLEGVTTGPNVVRDMVKSAEKDTDGRTQYTRLRDAGDGAVTTDCGRGAVTPR